MQLSFLSVLKKGAFLDQPLFFRRAGQIASRKEMIYQPAPHFHHDHRRPAGPGSGRRDKRLREGITGRRGKRRPGVWDVRGAPAAATRQPFSRSPVDL